MRTTIMTAREYLDRTIGSANAQLSELQIDGSTTNFQIQEIAFRIVDTAWDEGVRGMTGLIRTLHSLRAHALEMEQEEDKREFWADADMAAFENAHAAGMV